MSDRTLWDQGDDWPQPDDTVPTGMEAKAQALQALEEEGKRDTLRVKYARVLFRAAAYGVEVETDDGDTVELRALTDKEAAHVIGCQNTTAGARRNELMGDDPRFEGAKLIMRHEKRRSHVDDFGTEVIAWTMTPETLHAAKQIYG